MVAVIASEEARRLALALPEAVEQDHHGFPSFRVRGKIFATLPDPEHLRVFIDPDAVDEAVAESPAACAPLWWGKRLSGLAVHLPAVEAAVVAELLTDAWRRKAPVTLVREFDAADRGAPDVGVGEGAS